jgi:hypothetical protein
MKIRGQQVLLPTTLVGAYPRPVFLVRGTEMIRSELAGTR